MASSLPIQVTNATSLALNVYSTMSPAPTDPPSTDPAAYKPVYTLLGSVAANGTGNFVSDAAIARIVITRAADEFPLKLAVASSFTPGSGAIQLADADVTVAQAGWSFYQGFASQPFAPVSLGFTDLVQTTPVADLVTAAATYFSQNGAPGLSFGLFSALGYWATNQLFAFPGSYYCYQPPTGSSMGFVLPTTQVGSLVIANGTATYTPVGGTAQTLAFADSTLATPGTTATSGMLLTAILRDLTWEGQPEVITWGFVGTLDGQQFIAQSYPDPQLPWYAVAYDMVYGAFFTVQVAMALDGAISLLSTVGNGLVWLGQNAVKLVQGVTQTLQDMAQTAGQGSTVGDAADAINVDVDIDIDIDVDVDVDIDIDVDVDVDIDVDVDVDFIAVVDVDVDVDIDIDIDVVTDTETDIDVDTDIDTDVDVQPGAISKLLSSVGNWIMTKALPTLIEGAVMYVAFQTVGAILNAWKEADQQGIANLQPQQSTGLGLLVNYMLQDNLPVATRWTTFSEYAAEVQGDPTSLSLALSTLLQTANSLADTAQNAWRWSDSDQASLVAQMAPNTGANAPAAFLTLGAATFQGNPLPVKVGATVAMKYLSAQGAGA